MRSGRGMRGLSVSTEPGAAGLPGSSQGRRGVSLAIEIDRQVTLPRKRLINCHQVDVNQLMPLKYHWAWEHYINGCANHWMPTEVAMGKDIETWRGNELSP